METRRGNLAAVAGILIMVGGCTAVDATEHCVETRYGKVVNEQMATGLNATFLTSAECFPTTEQNHTLENVEVRSSDPTTLTVSGITVNWEYSDNVYAVFLDKRTHDAAVREINGAIEEGIKNAFTQFNYLDVSGARFAEIAPTIQAAIQTKVGTRAVVKNVLLSGQISGPLLAGVEQERARTMEQTQALQTANAAARTDSINNARRLASENVNAQIKELSAAAYVSNPALLRLEIAKELKSICGSATTCILGGTTVDALGLNAAGGR